MDEYRAQNRRVWDRWAELHVGSRFYDLEAFRAGRSTLDPLAHTLGDVRGKTLLHLQCHFGLDTLSWAREGARVTGVDFSGVAIRAARELAAELGIDAEFIESDVSAVPERLRDRFDFVFVSNGALCWLPEVADWARVVARCLAPGGTLLVVEGHPLLWSLDDARGDDLLVVRYPALEQPEPTRFEDRGSYAVPEDENVYVTHEWNHGLGEIVTALVHAGLVLTSLVEHTFVAWKALPQMRQREDGYWELPPQQPRVPLSYSLRARKPT